MLALKPGFDPATTSRTFLICASDYVQAVLMSGFVRSLAVEAPAIALDFKIPSSDVLEAFDRGSYDNLLASLPGKPEPLFSDTQVCLVARDSPYDDIISFDDYMNAGHLTLRVGRELSIAFEEGLFPGG